MRLLVDLIAWNNIIPKVFMMSLMVIWSSSFGQIEMIAAACGSTLSLFRAHKSSRKLSHIFLQRCRRFDFIFKKRKSIFFGIVLEFSFFLFFCWIGFGRKFPFFVKRKPKQENHSSLGHGSGSVGRVVFSDAREPWFKSQHRQNFIYKLYKLIK